MKPVELFVNKDPNLHVDTKNFNPNLINERPYEFVIITEENALIF